MEVSNQADGDGQTFENWLKKKNVLVLFVIRLSPLSKVFPPAQVISTKVPIHSCQCVKSSYHHFKEITTEATIIIVCTVTVSLK